jgi:hypothetical protein
MQDDRTISASMQMCNDCANTQSIVYCCIDTQDKPQLRNVGGHKARKLWRHEKVGIASRARKDQSESSFRGYIDCREDCRRAINYLPGMQYDLKRIKKSQLCFEEMIITLSLAITKLREERRNV